MRFPRLEAITSSIISIFCITKATYGLLHVGHSLSIARSSKGNKNDEKHRNLLSSQGELYSLHGLELMSQ